LVTDKRKYSLSVQVGVASSSVKAHMLALLQDATTKVSAEVEGEANSSTQDMEKVIY